MIKAGLWGMSEDRIVETIRTGRLADKRCLFGRKCFFKHFKDERRLYFVVVKFGKYEIKVITAWPQERT